MASQQGYVRFARILGCEGGHMWRHEVLKIFEEQPEWLEMVVEEAEALGWEIETAHFEQRLQIKRSKA